MILTTIEIIQLVFSYKEKKIAATKHHDVDYLRLLLDDDLDSVIPPVNYAVATNTS
ncbi:MAG: hypothetical protein V3V18_04455 [Methylococcales bacterium]